VNGDPTTQDCVQARGARLRVKLDGPPKAPVLVLSNSLGMSLEMWDRQVPRLSSFLRVVRYDHRGHGGSSAPPAPYTIDDLGNDLVDLLDALDVERAAICGLSLGGMTAMWLAAHRPERVSSIVVACSAPVLGPKEAWYERADAARRDGPASLLATLAARWFPPGVQERREGLVEEVAAMLATCDAEGYAGCCAAIAEMDLRPVLGDVAAPALVVAGAHDPVTPPSVALALAGELRAALVVLRASSHLANLTEPEAFTDAVLSHVAGDSARRGTAVRRAVLGDAHVERSAAHSDPLPRDFTDFVTRYAWGEVWSRPGLDRRTRSAVTLSLLISLGRYDELSFHVPAALRNGLTSEEIREVVLHSAIYAGVPAAHAALPVVASALEDARSADDGGDGEP
jgi:3-oxoadipate enol-lactonase/4-carboxymuconolactone decarboxylase